MKFERSMILLALTLIFASNVYANGFMAVANVSKIHGIATINKEKIKEGAEIAKGMKLKMAKPNDYVEVKFQNGHLVRFVGAIVKAEEINPKTYQFTLLKGKMFSIVKPLTKNENFLIKTKRASFVVSGTKFVIEEGKKQTYLLVSEGSVNTKTQKGSIDVKKDEDVTIGPARELKATLAAKTMIDKANAIFSNMSP